MSITGRANATVTATRMTGTTKKTPSSIGSFSVFIAPVSDEKIADIYGGIGNVYEIFVESQDILEGDRLDHNGKTYTVGGVQQYAFGSRPYSRLIAKSNA